MYRQRKYEEAESTARRTLADSAKMNDKLLKRDMLDVIARIAFRRGDYTAAIEYMTDKVCSLMFTFEFIAQYIPTDAG